MIQITRGGILSACGAGAFQRGEDYVRDGRVLELEVDAEQQLIYGQVAGSGNRVYEQHIALVPGARRARIEGGCECPVGYNCKHVVALLLTLEEQQQQQQSIGGERSLITWKNQFEAVTRQNKHASAPSDEEIVYVLTPAPRNACELLSVRRRRRKKDGSWGKIQSLPGGYWHIDAHRFMNDADRAILDLLAEAADGRWNFDISGYRGGFALHDILKTNRVCFGDVTLALQLGPPRVLNYTWTSLEQNRKQLQVALAECDTDWRIVATTPPYYVDIEAKLCGPLDTPLSSSEIILLRRMPPVPSRERMEIAQFLAMKLPSNSVPLPIEKQATLTVKPTPLLRLATHTHAEQDVHYAALLLIYGEHAIPLYPQSAIQLLPHGDGELVLQRDESMEEAFIDELLQRGFEPYHLQPRNTGDVKFLLLGSAKNPSPLRWLAFLDNDLPELRQQGWQVEIDSSFNLNVQRAERLMGELDGDNLGIQIEFNGGQIPLLPLLLRALELDNNFDKDIAVEIERGHWLSIPASWLRPVLNTLIELHERPGLDDRGRLSLHKYNFAPITQLEDELGESQFRWSGEEQRRALAEQLKGLRGVDAVATPASVRAELRAYQCEGLSWLVFLHRFGFGGILADDMGLGKTLQTLSFIQHLKTHQLLTKPALVVAPTSLLGNWLQEARKFTPELRVAVSHGPERRDVLSALDEYDLLITSYALAQRDATHLAKHPLSVLILDEAQAIKNPRAKISQAVRSYQADMRLCLTGTPLENHLGEFWAQYDFIMPGFLGSDRSFNQLYRKPIEKHGDDVRRQQLKQRTAPFLLRRTKDQVAKELPAKTEIVQTVTLDDAQHKLYQTVRASLEKEVRQMLAAKGLAKSHIQVLDALLKLRQICCDPSLLKIPSAAKVKQSAKLDALLQMLEEQLAEGRRILLFSQFTSMLAIIEREIQQRKIPYVKLTGQTRQRDTVINAFQSGEVPLFLISLKAGGVGLNLTAADTVIHYDPWWNPAVENQATDRAHRIGQTKPVFVYKLIAADTIEERIQKMQQQKKNLADALLGGEGAVLSKISGDDILKLFC